MTTTLQHASRTLPLLACAALAGCAAIKPAQLDLPPELASTPPATVQGLGGGRSGSFTLDGERGNFQRGRDRLALFDTVAFDRASTRYTLQTADGRSTEARCVGRQTTVSVGVLNGQPRPYAVQCEWTGAQAAQLSLAAPSAVPGAKAERSGSFTAGGVRLELRSVHQAQGSAWPLAAPLGYLVLHEGRAVGAVELNGTVPRLWRPAEGSALRAPVTLAALALALLWDPADAAP